MYFFMPLIPIGRIILIYVLAAVIPAALLLGYIYQKDTVEKEPPGLLLNLLWMGVLAALSSIVLESIGDFILEHTLSQSSPAYVIVMAFLVVAVVEEGTKLFFLRRRTWQDRNFNHLFDGVVYSAFVSLGFAAFENVKYVFSYGLGVAVPRALFAIPGHLGFSVFMGVFYGRARLCENRGQHGRAVANLVLGYLSAVFLHGFYDSCAMIGSGMANLIFYIFVIVMYFVVYRLIKHTSAADHAI